jgi:hypothetical protein
VTANDVLNQKVGIFIWGHARGAIPFQGGFLCISGPIVRTPGQFSGGNPPPDDCSGTMVLNVVATVPAALAPTLITLQGWYRDNAASFGSGLTDAIEVAYLP